MRRLSQFAALTTLLALVACGGGGQSAQTGPSAPPAASASPAEAPSTGTGQPASIEPGGTATPAPTPVPDPNLLSVNNGARVVSYPANLENDPDEVVHDGPSFNEGGSPPYVFVYELPTVETIASVEATLDATDPKDPQDPKHSLTVAFSTTSATDGFSDGGTLDSPSGDRAVVGLKPNAQARWVRLTYASPKGTGLDRVVLTGTLPLRTAAPVSGIFVEHDHPYKAGKDNNLDTSDDPWLVRAISVGDGIALFHCYAEKSGNTSVGTVTDGRTVAYHHDGTPGRLVINDEGTQMIGWEGAENDPIHYTATTARPKYCYPEPPIGTGTRRITVLDSEAKKTPYPLGTEYDAALKHYRIAHIPAAFLDADVLAASDVVVFNGVCTSDDYISPAQGKLLDDWVEAGHVATMYDSDMCGKTTHYGFLPYQFVTDNPGAGGAHGKRLIEVESDDLGSLDKSDAKRFLDAAAYAANDGNQLGDANTTVTKDDHWCGHLFGTNSNDVNGFMQMYAPYGKGFFVYDGFDEDDSSIPEYQRLRDFELNLPIPADLPCNVKVSMSFVLQPDREATFTAGKAQSMSFPMEVLANQGWKGHVTVAAQGPFSPSIDAPAFDMNGGTQPLKVAVTIPKTTAPGTYAVTVVATGDDGKTSQAAITFNGEAPLKKIPKKQRRIRLYGIHFDYDSAKIQPRSEPVIKEIADLMNADRTLRFQIEGHTDSDGGAAYNLKLSQARAQSVVNDLIHRYHIAASRLVPKGFGLTRPVASNATAGGKALNRRVELLRL